MILSLKTVFKEYKDKNAKKIENSKVDMDKQESFLTDLDEAIQKGSETPIQEGRETPLKKPGDTIIHSSAMTTNRSAANVSPNLQTKKLTPSPSAPTTIPTRPKKLS